MKKKTASHTILTLLLIGILTSSTTLSIQMVKADRTITINSDGSIAPSTAPIQRDGHSYMLTSDISESIVIQRNNTVLDGKGYSIQGDGTGQGISLYNVENITIKNTRITEFSRGIHLGHSSKNTITNNTLTNNTYGILANRSPETTIANNVIQDNKWDGIFITASPNSLIINNNVANQSKWGIYLGYSAESTLKNNTMESNRYNFGVSVDYIHDIDDSNTVNDKPIYYWINQLNRHVPADAGYVAVINSVNIEVKNLDLTKNGQGIIFVNSANNLLENSNVTGHGYYGIYLIDSSYNTVNNNTIANNDVGGIAVVSSTGNTVRNNTIKDNDTGIYLLESNNNHIHHNNFIDNARQAVNKDSTNVWDYGYPSGGNHWSDYTGVDVFSGPNQDQRGSDGIGDTPYIIDNENQDNYPLMHVVQKVPQNHIQTEPIILIIGIATTVTVVMLTYFIRKGKSRSSTKVP